MHPGQMGDTVTLEQKGRKYMRRQERLWSPFKKNGKLNIVFATDPWWKRGLARLRRQPLWHRIGALREGDDQP